MTILRRKTSILIICFMMLLAYPCVAFAANYGVAALNYASSIINYGTYGANYVMAAPIVSQLHVSSIYVIDSRGTGYNHAETGWAKSPPEGWTNPRFFVAWVDNGTYGVSLIGDAPLDSNHNYKVQNVLGTNKWRYYVDGTQKLERTYSTSYRCGMTVCSSERNTTLGDTNYSHFWALRWMNSSGTWSNWSDLRQFMDNDPDYDLNKISNTECFMEI